MPQHLSSGNMVGAAASTDGALPLFNGTLGKAVKAQSDLIYGSTIGASSTQTFLGNGITVAADNSVCIGNSAQIGSLGASGIAIGNAAQSRGTSNIAIGPSTNANAAADHAVAIGNSCIASNSVSLCIGNLIESHGIGTFASGYAMKVNHDYCFSHGYTNTFQYDPTTAASQITFGTDTQAIKDLWIGNGAASVSSPSASSLNVTGATGTNTAGANLTLSAGNSTGTGAGGSLLFRTAAAGTTGTSANALSSVAAITSTGYMGLGTISPAALLELVSTRYVNTNGIRLRTNDAAYASGTGAININAAFDTGRSGIQFLNDGGARIEAFDHTGATLGARLQFDGSGSPASFIFSNGVTNLPQIWIAKTTSQTANFFDIVDPTQTTQLFSISQDPNDSTVRVGIAPNMGIPVYKLECRTVRYNDKEAFALLTTDSTTDIGTGTGAIRMNPAQSSGRGEFLCYNTAGMDFGAYNQAGNTPYMNLRCTSAGVTHTGPGIGFFGTTPAGQQTGGAATAGGTYTAAEQGMINSMYSALRTYGLLT